MSVFCRDFDRSDLFFLTNSLYMDNPEAVNQMLWDRLAPADGVEGFPAALKTPAGSRRNSVSALGALGLGTSPPAPTAPVLQAH